MEASTRRQTTLARRRWAEEQTRTRLMAEPQASPDALLLYFLFTATDGPDHGVPGDVTAPAGDAPNSMDEVPQDSGDMQDSGMGDPDMGGSDQFSGSGSDQFSGGSDFGGGSGSGFDSGSSGGDSGGGF